MREDFSFTGITSSSIQEIILLYDWYACNAPEKTYEEMGFKNEDEFMNFRRRCNKISYNLRKNQYAQILAVGRDRLQNRIAELENELGSKFSLKYDDKYGADAKKAEDDVWSLKNVTAEQVKRVRPFSDADVANPTKEHDQGLLDEINGKKKFDVPFSWIKLNDWGIEQASNRQVEKIGAFSKVEETLRKSEKSMEEYKKDLASLEDRVVNYLVSIGLIGKKEDVELLATRNRAANYEGDIGAEIRKVEAAKVELDNAEALLTSTRKSLQAILDKVYEAERKVQELESTNKRIFETCISEKNRQVRNRLLINKLENETKALELKDAVKSMKEKHLEDFSKLDKMRKNVDELQAKYDAAVKEFK